MVKAMGYKDNKQKDTRIDLRDMTIYASHEVDEDGKVITFSADD